MNDFSDLQDRAIARVERSDSNSLFDLAHGQTFNLMKVLPGRASSAHTQRAYYRWIDSFLVAIAGLKPTTGKMRLERMSNLPIQVLIQSLGAPQLRAWLGQLAQEGHGKQGIGQARASIVTLADLLAETQWVNEMLGATLARVRPPRAEEGQRPGRWLSSAQLKQLIQSSREIANSDPQSLRNNVLMSMLCTMALRREELAAVRWNDFSQQGDDRIVLRVHGKGRKVAMIDVPRFVLMAVQQWERAVRHDDPQFSRSSPLLRRLWKGGRVSRQGLTSDGIWLIVSDSAVRAGIGHVAPHDLRRSVAGTLLQADVPIEKISKLLRHANVIVTERYLNRLPKSNEGAILMSDVLGFGDALSDEDLTQFP